jgi:hypothetical protein
LTSPLLERIVKLNMFSSSIKKETWDVYRRMLLHLSDAQLGCYDLGRQDFAQERTLVSDKLGVVLVVLGVMHFGNLYVFSRLRNRAQLPTPPPFQQPIQQQPWPQR